MKIPKYGNFQIQSQDKTLFLKVGSAPSSWPEKSWEVESALVILHIEEVFKFLKPPTPILSPLATLGNAINIMHLLKDVSIDIGFYYPFGQSLKADYFGHIKVEFTSPSEVGCNRDYPHPFNSVSHFYSSFWEDTKWDKKKFSADCSVTRFPPSEGFLAISFLNCEDEVISTWVTAYQLSPIQEDEVKKDLYTFVGVQIKTTRTTIYQSHLRRDFGMRKFSRVLLSFELKASKGKIYIGNVRFRTPTLLVFPRATITS